MKNRIINIALLLMSGVSAVSCSGWLDVTSSSKMTDTQLYSTKTGFHEALTGIYISMTSQDCYGKNYTWGANDLTCYPTAAVSNPEYTTWKQHLYNNVTATGTITSMWRSGYNVVANVNKFLDELEHNGVITDEEEFALLRGEAMGLRAYVMFDMLRMFGRDSWDGENAEKRTIPYPLVYTKDVHPQQTYKDAAKLLHYDIEGALECLKNDPVTGGASDRFEQELNVDGYWSNRTKHFNYYAALALAARVDMWEGDYDGAAGKAQEVIDGAIANGAVAWVDPEAIVKETNYDRRDWNLSSEHLFSLDVTDLYSIIRPYYYSMDINGNIFVDPIAADLLFANQGGSLSGAEDIRGTALWLDYTSMGYKINKYYSSTDYYTGYRNRIAMIRLSEMYYIIAETKLRQGDMDGFIASVDEVRRHRGISVSIAEDALPEGSTSDDAFALLEAEYVKEFVGEGRLFFFYKRLGNLPMHIFANSVDYHGKLMYPYPTAETSYGRVQD